MREITRILAEARKSRGLSQTELANMLGTKRQFVSEWERCEANIYSKTQSPSLRYLTKWAAIFGYEIVLKPKDLGHE